MMSGARQGSYLGRFNDLRSAIKSNSILMYANDVKPLSFFSLESHSYQFQIGLLYTWIHGSWI